MAAELNLEKVQTSMDTLFKVDTALNFGLHSIMMRIFFRINVTFSEPYLVLIMSELSFCFWPLYSSNKSELSYGEKAHCGTISKRSVLFYSSYRLDDTRKMLVFFFIPNS